MSQAALSLQARANRMYRRLLLLQGLFHQPRDEESDGFDNGDRERNLALGAAVREVLDELTEHAHLLTAVPFPISEWRPGDTRDHERWRALTEVERREILSLVSGYDNLIAWAERMTSERLELAALVEMTAASPAHPPSHVSESGSQAAEFLKAERTRLNRFRQEMLFLNRRPDS